MRFQTSDADFREALRRMPDWKKPPIRWHRVKLLPHARAFLHATPAGEMRHVGPGDVATIDSETLEMRRRDLEVLE